MSPNFIVLIEAEEFQGYSWTVQCEILEHQLLGGVPTNEDLVLIPTEEDTRLCLTSLG
jgi:hypothetical protein